MRLATRIPHTRIVTNGQKMHRAGWIMSKRKCAQSRECVYSHQEAEVTGEDDVTSVE